jgi:hypothetical protein
MKWGLSWKHSRLPLFYILIIILEFIKYLFITRIFSQNYTLVFCLGILQWTFSLLAIHHLKLVIERDKSTTVEHTIRAFYLLNFAVSLFFLALLIFHPIWLSFWGQGKDISFSDPSAGDAILGISFDSSTMNATINCLGLIYFLYKKDYLFSFICLSIIIFCTSNVSFIIILGALVLMVITVRSNRLRINSAVAAFALVFLYLAASASNRLYIHDYFVQLYILNKNPDLRFKNGKRILKNGNIHSPHLSQQDSIRNIYSFDRNKLKIAISQLFSLEDQFKILESPGDSTTYLSLSNEDLDTKPGKLISFFQTYNYLKNSPGRAYFGAGIGNFSSKLAFRAAGTKIIGSYPEKYVYSSPAFRYNHLRTFNYYISGYAGRHSIMNFPFSVYNQIFGEYGLAGAFLFIVFYLGYFIARYRRLSYGRYMIIVLLGFFLFEYWFEYFSLVVIFELFMLLNIKEGREEVPYKIRIANPPGVV